MGPLAPVILSASEESAGGPQALGLPLLLPITLPTGLLTNTIRRVVILRYAQDDVLGGGRRTRTLASYFTLRKLGLCPSTQGSSLKFAPMGPAPTTTSYRVSL